MRLPDAVVAVAACGVAPAVDLEQFTPGLVRSADITIDMAWWRGQAGMGPTGHAVTHLPGCRHHASVASWDLPSPHR